MGTALLSYVTLIAGVVLYGAASALFFIDVARSSASQRSAEAEGAPKPERRAPILLAAAALLHFGYVCAASFLSRVCPIYSVHFILSVTAVLAAFFYVGARWTAARRGQNENAAKG